MKQSIRIARQELFLLSKSEVVFIGKHVYQSRILKDGYSIEDVINQIAHAMEIESVVLIKKHMTAMENPTLRADGYGNQVNDRIVFECTRRHPRPELFSVVPKGDVNKPGSKKGLSS